MEKIKTDSLYGEMIKSNKIWLLIMNKEKHYQYFKYFDTEWEKDKFKEKIKWITSLYIIEDSSDMNWGNN